MVKWEIKSEDEREVEGIEKWGREEWARRKEICERKREELENEHSWEARCVIGSQFEVLAKELPQAKWDGLAQAPVDKWVALIMRLADGA